LHHSLDAVQFGFDLQLLYKAYACEKKEGGNYLLPGYPAQPGAKAGLSSGPRFLESAISISSQVHNH